MKRIMKCSHCGFYIETDKDYFTEEEINKYFLMVEEFGCFNCLSIIRYAIKFKTWVKQSEL